MDVFVSGCSFTHNQWPKHLTNPEFGITADITEVGFPGFGNEYIADSIVVSHSKKNYDLSLIMWTGMTRRDIVTAPGPFYDNYLFKKTVGDHNYIASGGMLGSWQHNSMTRKIFSPQYLIENEEELAYISLLEIIKAQSFLKAMGRKYYMMSYVNYWNLPPGHRSKNMDVGLNMLPRLRYLVDMIDFSNWIFINDNKDGIYELAVSNNWIIDDGFHPDDRANYEWAKIICQRINQDFL